VVVGACYADQFWNQNSEKTIFTDVFAAFVNMKFPQIGELFVCEDRSAIA